MPPVTRRRSRRSIEATAERERRILNAAAELFCEHGFASVSVDVIGETAGISGPAIYRHFESKEVILATLFDEALDGLFRVTGGPLPDPFEELRRRSVTFVEYVLSKRQLTTVMFREDRALSPALRRRFHRRQLEYIDGWVDCFKRCFPERSDTEIDVCVQSVIGMLISVVHWPERLLEEADHIPHIVASLVMRGVVKAGADGF
jgi:AcrR family transcriptional regulator